MAYGDEVITANRSSANGYEQPSETRKGYTGYERDIESGLDFAQARYYNPSHGRFTSVDPLTASANVKDPQTFNRYTYALNSPYKFTDPLGLISQSTVACGRACGNDDRGSGGGYLSEYGNNGITIQVGYRQDDDPPKAPPKIYVFFGGVSREGSVGSDNTVDSNGKVVDNGPDFDKLRDKAAKAGIELVIIDENSFDAGAGRQPGQQWVEAFNRAVQDTNSLGVVFIGHSGAGEMLLSSANGGNYNETSTAGVNAKTPLIALFGCDSQSVGRLFSSGTSSVIGVDSGENGGTNIPALSKAGASVVDALIAVHSNGRGQILNVDRVIESSNTALSNGYKKILLKQDKRTGARTWLPILPKMDGDKVVKVK